MKIIHVLADGTEKTDITDHVVKVNEAEAFYDTLHRVVKKVSANEKNKEG